MSGGTHIRLATVLVSCLGVAEAAAQIEGEFSHPEQVCEGQSPDIQPPGAEQARMAACLPDWNEAVRERVGRVLANRVRKRPTNPGLNRFIAVGASASRNMYFLTGFGRHKYSLAPEWAFLERTVRWFSGSGRRRPFLHKGATVSGTSAGAWVYGGRICDDCPRRLDRELGYMNAAYAVLMFGTNNVSMHIAPGHRKLFLTRVAAGPLDPGCSDRACLPPWQPGGVNYPTDDPSLVRWVERWFGTKRARFGKRYRMLVKRLLRKNVVPVLTTIPPMPRRWLDEDLVAELNEEIRAIATEESLPLIDFWCALTPMTDDGALDWSHPLLTSGKGIGKDRYHPRATRAFDVSDENLVHGYNARNVLTLLTLHALEDLIVELGLDTPERILAHTERGL